LQGNLNELAQLLTQNGNTEEAKELENAAKALEQAEECKTPEEVKKKGIAGKLKRIADELCDKDSKLYKTVEGIKHGAGIVQDIAKGYNDFAQWVGLPQVPRLFLKK
jgi:diacylglycerol kinase family enzyme